jgi:hypothetical protein
MKSKVLLTLVASFVLLAATAVVWSAECKGVVDATLKDEERRDEFTIYKFKVDVQSPGERCAEVGYTLKLVKWNGKDNENIEKTF